MSIPVVTFFSNRGGVGQTALIYHLADPRHVPPGGPRPTGVGAQTFSEDSNCLATLKNYRSLVPLADEARKPIFALRAADGALGGPQAAVQDAHRAFKELALEILQRVGIETGGC